MIVSRAVVLRNIFRQINTIPQTNPARFQIRNMSAWAYRVAPPPSSKKAVILAEVMAGFAIWWILWHFYTEPEHVTGEWPIVEPSEWTDEELGIPPDSFGPAKRVEKEDRRLQNHLNGLQSNDP